VIHSLFEEAKHEALLYLLQKQWDLHLIKAWRDRPFLRMSDCAGEFEKKHKDAIPEHMKRFPKYEETHFYLTVSRFIAAFLPKTNDALWDGKTDEEVVAIMSKENLMRQCVDRRKVDAERYAVNKTRKTMAATDASRRAHEEHNGMCARRSWTTVK